MARVKKLDLGMTALDELFMNDKERAENKLPKIFDIPLSEIDDFPDHPYRVLDDEDMQNLMESIRDRGVITPAMVRKKDDGRYEMISGHRRKHASERLGLETLRCEVVEVSRDEAIILMKNRTIIGIVCMILAVAMTFAVAPLVNRLTSDTTTVVRLKQDVGRGAKITAEQVETVKVKTDTIPQGVYVNTADVIGKYASSTLYAGDTLVLFFPTFILH